MTNTLDREGLASVLADIKSEYGTGFDVVCEAAITAYFAATVPADIAALVERLLWVNWPAANGGRFKRMSLDRSGIEEVVSALEALASRSPNETLERRFEIGHRVTKIKGSSWTGRIVGFYATALTPIGYCVESENEPGSVQIYPEAAIRAMKEQENGEG